MKSNSTIPMKTSNLSFFHSRTSLAVIGAALTISAASPAQAAVSYYVGVDTLETLTSGAYAGLANPNYQRLTFLYAHFNQVTPSSNHYHSKATRIYTGPNLGAGTAITTSASNYVPEGATPPLTLSVANGGLYDGKLVSAPVAGNFFSFLTMEDTGKISGFAPGTGENFMFNSSGGRWTGALTGADVHLELVSLSAGLNVGDSTALNLFTNPGDDLHLEDSFSFTPIFWMDANAANGTYTARFKLTDETATFGDSGTFEYRFQVIPEPSSFAVLALAGIALGFRRNRAHHA